MSTLTFILPTFPVDDETTPAQEGHVAEALERSPEYLKNQPAWTALLSALVAPVQRIEDALQQLLTERGIDDAIGVQLDALGLVVGEPRNGLSDDVYRRHVRARIATNRSKATVRELITISKLIITPNHPSARITVEQWGAAHVVVRIDDTLLDAGLDEVLIQFLRDAVAAGVRIVLEYSSEAPEEWFRFDTAGAGFDAGELLASIE